MSAIIEKVSRSVVTVDRASGVLQALYDHAHYAHGGSACDNNVLLVAIDTACAMLGQVREDLDKVETELRNPATDAAATIAHKIVKRSRKAVAK